MEKISKLLLAVLFVVAAASSLVQANDLTVVDETTTEDPALVINPDQQECQRLCLTRVSVLFRNQIKNLIYYFCAINI